MKKVRLALLAASIAACAVTHATTRIEVLGELPSPGPREIQEGLRLGELLQHERIDPQSYWLGASWQRQSLQQQQRRLKGGILFDLIQVQRLASLQENTSLASTAKRLSERVAELPVTGRRLYRLDPLEVELNAAHSPRLLGGDRLIFPARPSTVRITGAVSMDCTLPFVPLQPAYRYAQDCPTLADADPDYLFVIQPDGKVTPLGVALWNREDNAEPPAPGAVLLVPLDASQLKDNAPDLNRELADFLATQPLPAESP
ncbi:capsule biosynthesis GfcC family protein [Pseudomonas sp. HS-18]|uniref:capsule biosynthesis GfcC family protein n=1 Tax=Pseudomonas sp. HS-18 TaxID=2879114 RepID=UPI001CF0CD16|nr:capsule biosynthesis GfcC family protein [Pseudomonas sp. HS-18]UCL88686.1 capsule biosynthesis GfcC family protein [Pseudomonas sp. HS-18]